MSAEGSGPHGQWISRRDSLFSRFSLCQRHHPTKEDLPFAGWRRLEAKPLTSLHPANGKGLWPLTLIQRVFLVLVLRSVLKIRSRRIGLTPTFSRHGRAQASLALLIWPIEKVGPSTAQRIFSEWIHGKFICKGEGKGHVQAYAPTGAMGLKRWGGHTSKLDGYPVTSDPHLWWQVCPWFSITIYSLAKSGLYEMIQHIQSTENIHWILFSTQISQIPQKQKHLRILRHPRAQTLHIFGWFLLKMG